MNTSDLQQTISKMTHDVAFLMTKMRKQHQYTLNKTGSGFNIQVNRYAC